MFSREYCKIFKNIFFEEHLWTSSSTPFSEWFQNFWKVSSTYRKKRVTFLELQILDTFLVASLF